jgi:hypothetical protein
MHTYLSILLSVASSEPSGVVITESPLGVILKCRPAANTTGLSVSHILTYNLKNITYNITATSICISRKLQ